MSSGEDGSASKGDNGLEVNREEIPPGFVLAGTASGVGKTVATLAVIEAFSTAGHAVQPGKVGPDFIDPSHHRAVAGRPSRTLDLWLQGPAGVARNYCQFEGDVAVVEGVMGLYDGDCSSTAMVAEALRLPVVLVVDARSGLESVGATVLGFVEYAEQTGRDIEVAGVLLQRSRSGRHTDRITEALPPAVDYLGRLPPDDELKIPDRHLGLVQAGEAPVPTEALGNAAKTIETTKLQEIAENPDFSRGQEDQAADISSRKPQGTGETTDGDAPTIGMARDSAFSFYYPATVEYFREHGTLEWFSPLAGDSLPDCDALYLPGGYPELYAEDLAASATLETIATRAANGLPIFGECGGMMVLCESLETTDGETYPMAGVLPATVRLCDRFQALDHVELHPRRGSPISGDNQPLRGHEFHYSRAAVDSDGTYVFDCSRGTGIEDGKDGLIEYNTVGTYAHFHPECGVFDQFLNAIPETKQ